MNKLKINLYGELWRLTQLKLTSVEYAILQNRALELKTSIKEALLDVCFFENEMLVNVFSYADLKNVSTSGLLNTYKNQVEVWYSGKKVLILQFHKNYVIRKLGGNGLKIISPGHG